MAEASCVVITPSCSPAGCGADCLNRGCRSLACFHEELRATKAGSRGTQSLELHGGEPAEDGYSLLEQHTEAKVMSGQVSVSLCLPKLASCCCSTPREHELLFSLCFYRAFYEGFQIVSYLRRCPLHSELWCVLAGEQ